MDVHGWLVAAGFRTFSAVFGFNDALYFWQGCALKLDSRSDCDLHPFVFPAAIDPPFPGRCFVGAAAARSLRFH